MHLKAMCDKKSAEIEFASTGDAREIADLSRNSIEQGLSWRYTAAEISKAIACRTKNVVVARRGKRLAGFGIMNYGEEHANLDLLAVKWRYRRNGIGTKIVRWLEDVANTAGIFHHYVQVRKTNTGALRFYAQLGYEVIDIVPKFYQLSETAVILYKDTASDGTAT